MLLEQFFSPNNHHMVIQVRLTAVEGKKKNPNHNVAEFNVFFLLPPEQPFP